jgi:hypothetical protein
MCTATCVRSDRTCPSRARLDGWAARTRPPSGRSWSPRGQTQGVGGALDRHDHRGRARGRRSKPAVARSRCCRWREQAPTTSVSMGAGLVLAAGSRPDDPVLLRLGHAGSKLMSKINARIYRYFLRDLCGPHHRRRTRRALRAGPIDLTCCPRGGRWCNLSGSRTRSPSLTCSSRLRAHTR